MDLGFETIGNATLIVHDRGPVLVTDPWIEGSPYCWLEGDGFDITVLADRQWTPISDRVRVLCMADYNQDAVLLVDIGGRLVTNLNDASDRPLALPPMGSLTNVSTGKCGATGASRPRSASGRHQRR